MNLAPLRRRSATADVLSEYDDLVAMRREWDLLRAAAWSAAERDEIDTMFSRSMP